MPKVSCLITHSIGELDILLPIIYNIKKKNNVKISIIFTVKKVYDNFEKNNFFKYFLDSHFIEYHFIQSSNKFDFPYNKRNLIKKINLRILKFIYFFICLKKIFNSKFIMHEITNQIDSTFVIYILKKISKKNIYVYNHALGSHKKNTNVLNVNQFKSSIYLSFHKNEEKYIFNKGFKEFIYIGNPKLDSAWIEYLKNCKLFHKNNTRKNILILLQNSSNFVDQVEYFNISLKLIDKIKRNFPNIEILLKMHPRDDYKKILSNFQKIDNVTIYHDDIMFVISDSLFIVSLHTSAILDAFIFQKTIIEFCLPKHFWKVQNVQRPMYSNYTSLSVQNLDDFNFNLKKLKNNNFIKKKPLEKINLNLEFFNE